MREQLGLLGMMKFLRHALKAPKAPFKSAHAPPNKMPKIVIWQYY